MITKTYVHPFFQLLSIEIVNGQKKTSDVGEKYSCARCEKQYDHKGSLARHMQTHTGRFNFYCDQCKVGINDSRDYKLHMDKHAGVQYKCDYCPKVFALSRTRDYHMSVHTGFWRFTCDQCDKGFNNRTTYEKHSQMHFLIR